MCRFTMKKILRRTFSVVRRGRWTSAINHPILCGFGQCAHSECCEHVNTVHQRKVAARGQRSEWQRNTNYYMRDEWAEWWALSTWSTCQTSRIKFERAYKVIKLICHSSNVIFMVVIEIRMSCALLSLSALTHFSCSCWLYSVFMATSSQHSFRLFWWPLALVSDTDTPKILQDIAQIEAYHLVWTHFGAAAVHCNRNRCGTICLSFFSVAKTEGRLTVERCNWALYNQ